MINSLYRDALKSIESAEQEIGLGPTTLMDDAYRLTVLLKEQLSRLKTHVLNTQFSSDAEEISFFKTVKPQILGKLIFYNKVFRIESACPVPNGDLYRKYFLKHMQDLKQQYEEHICQTEFYRYYRLGRSDWDHQFFQLGKIDLHDGVSSFFFEIDTDFSTFYDYKVARIIASELLYDYLHSKLEPESVHTVLQSQGQGPVKEVVWTDSKNSLIELIYALHASGSISHGKLGIRRITNVFQSVFGIQLGDIHHAFHRMKDRAQNRSLFLDQLKSSLHQHMDKNL